MEIWPRGAVFFCANPFFNLVIRFSFAYTVISRPIWLPIFAPLRCWIQFVDPDTCEAWATACARVSQPEGGTIAIDLTPPVPQTHHRPWKGKSLWHRDGGSPSLTTSPSVNNETTPTGGHFFSPIIPFVILFVFNARKFRVEFSVPAISNPRSITMGPKTSVFSLLFFEQVSRLEPTDPSTPVHPQCSNDGLHPKSMDPSARWLAREV